MQNGEYHEDAPAPTEPILDSKKILQALVVAAILGLFGKVLALDKEVAVQEAEVNNLVKDVGEIKGDVKKILQRMPRSRGNGD